MTVTSISTDEPGECFTIVANMLLLAERERERERERGGTISDEADSFSFSLRYVGASSEIDSGSVLLECKKRV